MRGHRSQLPTRLEEEERRMSYCLGASFCPQVFTITAVASLIGLLFFLWGYNRNSIPTTTTERLGKPLTERGAGVTESRAMRKILRSDVRADEIAEAIKRAGSSNPSDPLARRGSCSELPDPRDIALRRSGGCSISHSWSSLRTNHDKRSSK